MTMIFVNLPVESLERSVTFFTKLGFSFNPDYTDEKATCMIISENVFAMLLVKPFFHSFTPHTQVADAHTTTEVLVAISRPTREAVDEMIQKALEAGGREDRKPQDLGFMYQRAFADPDGHQWELVWMADSSGTGHQPAQ